MASDSTNFFRDNDDLLFQFRHGIKWDEIVDLTEAGYTLPDGPKNLEEARAFYEDVMSATGEFAAEQIAPRALQMDEKGTRLVDGEVLLSDEANAIFSGMAELGLFGLTIPRELGGTNCPMALYFIAGELIARADVSVMTHFSFHGGIASAMLLYANREGSIVYDGPTIQSVRWSDAIQEIATGENFGCMVMTEPGAGSDLAAIRGTAVEKNGKWLLNGEKIFITSGHGQYQFVLMRTEGRDSGLKGLSLFMVPRKIERDGKLVDNVKVTKIEEKLGHHASPTCSLQYEDSEGELVGKRGQGFQLMLLLMNSARIGVGFEALGNAEAAYRMAKSYAAERMSMGKPIAQHELVAEMLLDMDIWIRAMRALAIEAINAVEISAKLEILLKHRPPADEDEKARLESRQKRLARRARRLTPLLKYVTSEKTVEISRNAMQIFGGMGYIDETGVHKLLRDALVMPVYEGTSQIQALMATKDHLLWAAKDPAGFLRRAARARLLARTAVTPLLRDVNRADSMVYSATETLLLRIFGQKVRNEWEEGLRSKDPAQVGRYLAKRFLREWDMRADFSHGLLHAERLTKMLADVAMAKLLARQAQRFPERKRIAEIFVRKMLLRVEALSKEIDQGGEEVLEVIEAERKRGEVAT